MNLALPADWAPWRSSSPLGDKRPTRADLAAALHSELGPEDVLPFPTDEESAGRLRVLVVGINPSPWTASVNAPFARPGNRFWSSLSAAGITPHTVNATEGLSEAEERMLAELGIGVTNLSRDPRHAPMN